MTPIHSPLASPEATRDTLAQYGVELKKALGQNFLVDDNVIGKIMELAQIGPDDLVLEVGPGIGTLTLALLGAAAGVISIERDRTLAPVLADTAGAHDGFELVLRDALAVTSDEIHAAAASISSRVNRPLPAFPTLFAANLPYAVAATVIYDFFERFESIQSATVMVQKEVADRICAAPGNKDYGAYTVGLSMMARPTGRFDVAPTSFMPPPHVTSTVIRLERCAPSMADGSPATPEVCAAATFAAKAAFAQRRKTIKNSMRSYLGGCGIDAAALDDALAQAGIAASQRGEKLSQQTYLLLGQAMIDHALLP